MATAGDERSPYVSRGDGEISRKRPFRREINEELQTVSQEAERNNSTGVPELEQMLKQMTFTRSEIQQSTALLHSRICDEYDVVERDATSQQQPTTIENLSSDLLSNIFIRLFAKQLAQLWSVSKSWNALLSESSFVKSHLHCSIKNNDQILLVFYRDSSPSSSSSDCIPFTAHSCQSPDLELTNFIKLPPVNPETGHTPPSMIKVIGSVHGLICSSYGDDVIQIWNPSLSAVSTLPRHSIPSRSYYKISLRFGFDPNNNDYKVVKLSYVHRPAASRSAPSVREWLQVVVYSMRKGSWKLITQTFPSHVTRIFAPAYLCVDGHEGHLHWLGDIDEEGDRQTIVAFDLGSDTFLEIPLPDSLLDGNHHNVLGVLGGKPCVMSYDEDGTCEVWVMDEYGVPESWFKSHVFQQFVDELIQGFTSHGELVFEDDHLCLVWYDPIADKTKILGKLCHQRYKDTIIEYVDSLVWVPPPARLTSSLLIS